MKNLNNRLYFQYGMTNIMVWNCLLSQRLIVQMYTYIYMYSIFIGFNNNKKNYHSNAYWFKLNHLRIPKHYN